MKLDNLTTLPAIVFRQLDHAGNLDAVVAVRGRFLLRLDAPMIADTLQPGLQWQDAYAGDPHTTSLLRSTDLTPFRPGTDVSVLGEAHAPGSTSTRSWTCGIRIADRLDRVLRVTGPRRWAPQPPILGLGSFRRMEASRPNAWSLTEPTPVLSVPLDWSLAHGGPTLGTSDTMSRPPFPDNPLGSG